MFNYDYINELGKFGTCIFADGENVVEMAVENNKVSIALYEFQSSETVIGYSILYKFEGVDEEKGLIWACGVTSGINHQKIFNSYKETNRYYHWLKKKAPENFKLIYEGAKNIG